MQKIHSQAWFKEKVQQTQQRVNSEWSKSMLANAVFASATLPQPVSRSNPSSEVGKADTQVEAHDVR